ncbi:MAG: L,D-transpeptidase family protein [Deltaproteobacteria bacterium]|nr:L,D-transpeptidase family protein [Deltaproteobacteria bacterium]
MPRFRAVVFSWAIILLTPVFGCAPATPQPTEPEIETDLLPLTEKADRILVEKGRRELALFRGDRELRRYRVALGTNPEGDKRCEGDRRTPEGRYRIAGRNPSSAYHRSLRISYPDEADRAEAKREGCPPGGDIMIHGLPPSWSWVGKNHARTDWTLGCIAMTDDEIDELWDAVADGTPIEIRP